MLLICSQGSHKHVSQISLHCMQTRIYTTILCQKQPEIAWSILCHVTNYKAGKPDRHWLISWKACWQTYLGAHVSLWVGIVATTGYCHVLLPGASEPLVAANMFKEKRKKVLEAITWGNIAFGHYIMSPPWHQPPDLCSLYCTRGDKRKCLPCAWNAWKFFLAGYLWGNKAKVILPGKEVTVPLRWWGEVVEGFHFFPCLSHYIPSAILRA